MRYKPTSQGSGSDSVDEYINESIDLFIVIQTHRTIKQFVLFIKDPTTSFFPLSMTTVLCYAFGRAFEDFHSARRICHTANTCTVFHLTLQEIKNKYNKSAPL